MFQGFLCIFFLHVLFACCFHPGTSSHLGYRTNFSVAGLEFESKSQCVPGLCHRTFGMTSSCFMACKDSPNIYGFQGFVFGCFLFLYEYGGRFYINKYARHKLWGFISLHILTECSDCFHLASYMNGYSSGLGWASPKPKLFDQHHFFLP